MILWLKTRDTLCTLSCLVVKETTGGNRYTRHPHGNIIQEDNDILWGVPTVVKPLFWKLSLWRTHFLSNFCGIKNKFPKIDSCTQKNYFNASRWIFRISLPALNTSRQFPTYPSPVVFVLSLSLHRRFLSLDRRYVLEKKKNISQKEEEKRCLTE